jgi:uncharacterized membrane protein YkvA (DUF1232 family)
MLNRLKRHARRLKTGITALHLAMRHPDTPVCAKLIAAAVVAYALSPVDLIPDFIPVLGYLDDLIIVPAGIALAIRMVPGPVMAECRARSREFGSDARSLGRLAALAVVVAWTAVATAVGLWLYGALTPPTPAP